MTQPQLGRRLDVSKQTVLQLEQREVDGGIRLATLRRAAEALDCPLVYAFVLNTSLKETVHDQARRVAAAEMARVDQTMLLEDQRVEDHKAADRLEVRVGERGINCGMSQRGQPPRLIEMDRLARTFRW